jgi:hypothetical protein
LLGLDKPARVAIDVLPRAAVLALAEVFALLAIDPYVGRPINPVRTPDGPVRQVPFGTAELVTYLIVEHVQRVDVLLVHRAG